MLSHIVSMVIQYDGKKLETETRKKYCFYYSYVAFSIRCPYNSSG